MKYSASRAACNVDLLTSGADEAGDGVAGFLDLRVGLVASGSGCVDDTAAHVFFEQAEATDCRALVAALHSAVTDPDTGDGEQCADDQRCSPDRPGAEAVEHALGVA